MKPRLIATSLLLAVAFFGLVLASPSRFATVSATFGGSGTFTQHTFQNTPYLLYVPSTLPVDRPATVLIAIHGMGADPESFASGLVSAAEQNGWVMLVPHIPYGDWTQTDQLRGEEKKEMAWLNSLLEALPNESGLSLADKAVLYGFSRGGQLAHRFALAYPQRVMAAAIMSPGTYTLPISSSFAYDNQAPLEFPVGVSDSASVCGRSFDAEAVRHIPFWIGVGAKDNVPGDVPRQWDKYLGNTRVDRARSFAATLSSIGASVNLTLFPGLGHAESEDSRGQAMAFLSSHDEPAEVAAALGIDVAELADAGTGVPAN